MPVKIAINGRFQQRRITGVDRYAHEISRRLTAANYVITPTHPLGQVAGHLWEQIILPAKIQRDDILWSPANAGPWSVKNQVVTIHDASVFDHPEWFNPTFSNWARLSWKMLAKHTKAIITVSDFSRDRLILHLGIPEGKIHIVHNGVGKPFEPHSQKEIEIVKEKYGLDKPYFLFVGTDEPRKNLAGLIRAWESLNMKTHSLFAAGAEGKIFAPTASHAGSVTYVPDAELPALYSGAMAVIVPSFYEGFGLTALEAMACGAPVIASDIPVFRELFDGAVLFVNPHEPKEIANSILKMIEDKSLAMKLREKGLAHAATFLWDEAARKTQEVIK